MNVASTDLLLLFCHTVSLLWSFHPAPSPPPLHPPPQAASLWARSPGCWSRKPCGGWRKSAEVFRRCSRTTTKSSEVAGLVTLLHSSVQITTEEASLFIVHCTVLHRLPLLVSSNIHHLCQITPRPPPEVFYLSLVLLQSKEGGCTSETGGTGRPPGRIPRGRPWPPAPWKPVPAGSMTITLSAAPCRLNTVPSPTDQKTCDPRRDLWRR